ncbi:MAG: hypothetical protein RBT76_09955 [candidate division Zixibacteria bacterium]|nr:hypothetical protein [candidate division Zixibacteria bacterium]
MGAMLLIGFACTRLPSEVVHLTILAALWATVFFLYYLFKNRGRLKRTMSLHFAAGAFSNALTLGRLLICLLISGIGGAVFAFLITLKLLSPGVFVGMVMAYCTLVAVGFMIYLLSRSERFVEACRDSQCFGYAVSGAVGNAIAVFLFSTAILGPDLVAVGTSGSFAAVAGVLVFASLLVQMEPKNADGAAAGQNTANG